jgi:hypothetical protein
MKTVVLPAYMPVLRMKSGERKALLNLDSWQKARLLPLFDVQAPEAGMSTDDQLGLAVDFIREAWTGEQEFLLDISQLGTEVRTRSGMHPIQYLAIAFGQASLQPTMCFAFDRNDDAYEAAFLAVVRRHGESAKAAFRLQQHDLLFWEETLDRIGVLQTASHIASERLTVIADMQSLRGSQLVDASVLEGRFKDLAARGFGRLVVLGSNMPDSESLPRDGELEVRRLEVDIWEALLRAVPTLMFGDYGIIHPTSVYIPHSGMAIPAPKAKYTSATRWQVIKGHKPKKGEASQYYKIAGRLINAPWFRPNDLGWGAETIREIAIGRRGKRGNNTDWVAYTTEIHLSMTVKQVAVAVHAAAAAADADADKEI